MADAAAGNGSSAMDDLKDKVFPSAQRRPIGITGTLVTLAGAGLTVWTLYMGLVGTVGPILTRAIHLAFVIPLVFLLYPLRAGTGSRTSPSRAASSRTMRSPLW